MFCVVYCFEEFFSGILACPVLINRGHKTYGSLDAVVEWYVARNGEVASMLRIYLPPVARGAVRRVFLYFPAIYYRAERLMVTQRSRRG
jgi:hypothetical protein